MFHYHVFVAWMHLLFINCWTVLTALLRCSVSRALTHLWCVSHHSLASFIACPSSSSGVLLLSCHFLLHVLNKNPHKLQASVLKSSISLLNMNFTFGHRYVLTAVFNTEQSPTLLSTTSGCWLLAVVSVDVVDWLAMSSHGVWVLEKGARLDAANDASVMIVWRTNLDEYMEDWAHPLHHLGPSSNLHLDNIL